MMASQRDVAQLLQSSGVAVTGLEVRTEAETTIVRGQVATVADKTKAEDTIRSAIGDRVTSYLEVDAAVADAPSARPRGRTYTVRPGDDLRAIAERLYGDDMKWHGIRDANRDQLSNPDRIEPGMVLSIPDDPGGAGA
ncbi:MAG: hypothetical protein NVS4B3_06430 [Gemmatimonadaceae bacterium]